MAADPGTSRNASLATIACEKSPTAHAGFAVDGCYRTGAFKDVGELRPHFPDHAPGARTDPARSGAPS